MTCVFVLFRRDMCQSSTEHLYAIAVISLAMTLHCAQQQPCTE